MWREENIAEEDRIVVLFDDKRGIDVAVTETSSAINTIQPDCVADVALSNLNNNKIIIIYFLLFIFLCVLLSY